jgi:hypothetical protein
VSTVCRIDCINVTVLHNAAVHKGALSPGDSAYFLAYLHAALQCCFNLHDAAVTKKGRPLRPAEGRPLVGPPRGITRTVHCTLHYATGMQKNGLRRILDFMYKQATPQVTSNATLDQEGPAQTWRSELAAHACIREYQYAHFGRVLRPERARYAVSCQCVAAAHCSAAAVQCAA